MDSALSTEQTTARPSQVLPTGIPLRPDYHTEQAPVERTSTNAATNIGVVTLTSAWGQIVTATNIVDFLSYPRKVGHYTGSISEFDLLHRKINYYEAMSRFVEKSRLSRRLRFLVEMLKQEPDVELAHLSKSLDVMLNFIETAPSVKYPNVVITPKNNFYFEWRRDKGRFFSLEFFPDGVVGYVVFSEDPKVTGHVRRASGTTSWQTVLDVVRPFAVVKWLERT